MVVPLYIIADYQYHVTKTAFQICLYHIKCLLVFFHNTCHHSVSSVSSVRNALASKLRGPGFKSRPGTVGGPLTIIMWGAQPGWKLVLSEILLPRANKVTLLLIFFTWIDIFY